MEKVILLLLVAMMALTTGCATITRGATEPFVVKTDPAGANVTFSTGETCITPCTVEKRRKEAFILSVIKEGYEPAEVQIVSGVSGAGAAGMAGNIVFGGVVGAVVDGRSGAMRDLSPNPVILTLVHDGVTVIEEVPFDPLANNWSDICPQHRLCHQVGSTVSVNLADGRRSDRKVVGDIERQAGDINSPPGLEPPDIAPVSGFYFILAPDEYTNYYALLSAEAATPFNSDRR